LQRWQVGPSAPELAEHVAGLGGAGGGKPKTAKPAPKLPPEFRPSLVAPEKKTAKPAKPIVREEGLPPLNILMAEQAVRADERTINQTAGLIMKTLSEFGIPATVIGYRVGPAVTQFAVQPGFIKRPGASEDDDAQQMKARGQIANLQKDWLWPLGEDCGSKRQVQANPMLASKYERQFHGGEDQSRSLRASFPAQQRTAGDRSGRDVSGNPVVADLACMPHLQ
jgi:S-DNA-T family DNA segregation ATPase FtsK/SpoIIIE